MLGFCMVLLLAPPKNKEKNQLKEQKKKREKCRNYNFSLVWGGGRGVSATLVWCDLLSLDKAKGPHSSGGFGFKDVSSGFCHCIFP